MNTQHKAKILIFLGSYYPGFKAGGPIKTVSNLIESTSDEFDYRVVTKDRDLGDEEPYNSIKIGDWNKIGRADVYYSCPGFKGLIQQARVMLSHDYDIVYLNSFFSVRFSLVPALFARVLNKRVVLGPRGEFSKGALRIKPLRKKIYILLYKIFRLALHPTFQASSKYELDDIINIFGDSACTLVAEDIGSQVFSSSFSRKEKESVKCVIICRISSIKNIDYAIEVLRSVSVKVEYDIYGPIEDNEYWGKCVDLISSLPPHIKVTYKGTAHPDDIIKILSNYDMFFMPTKGENYSHIIAESLCAGLPILIADTTPWRNLEQKGIGWDLPLEHPQGFASKIEELALMSTERHTFFRQQVISWAKNKFGQTESIEDNKAIFRYTLNKR